MFNLVKKLNLLNSNNLFILLLLSLTIIIFFNVNNIIFYRNFSISFFPLGSYVIIFTMLIVGISSLFFNNKYSSHSLIFQIDNTKLLVIFILLSVLLCSFQLLIIWSDGIIHSENSQYNYSLVSYKVPWSDAGSFLSNAQKLIFEGALCDNCQRRIFVTAFQVTKLLIANFDFSNSLIFQSALFGTGCAIFSFCVARSHGFVIGLITYAVIFSLSSNYIYLNLSEIVGISFSLLAFSFIWSGIFYNKFFWYCCGVFVFCISQLARPGPVLIIPCLIFFSMFAFPNHNRIYKLITLIIITTISFSYSKLLLLFYGDPTTNTTIGNFYQLFYGMVRNTGPMDVFKHYPQIYNMSFEESESFIKNKIISSLTNEPLLFFYGLSNYFLDILQRYPKQLVTELLGENKYLISFSIFVYVSAILNNYIKKIKNSKFSTHDKNVKKYSFNLRDTLSKLFSYNENNVRVNVFLIIITTGYILSLPFIFKATGFRSSISFIPIIAVIISIILYSGLTFNDFKYNQNFLIIDKTQKKINYIISFIILFITLTSLISPYISNKLLISDNKNIQLNCPKEQFTFSIAKKTLAHAKVSNFYNNLKVHEANEWGADFRKIGNENIVFMGYDFVQKNTTYGFGHIQESLIDSSSNFISGCATKVKHLLKVESIR